MSTRPFFEIGSRDGPNSSIADRDKTDTKVPPVNRNDPKPPGTPPAGELPIESGEPPVPAFGCVVYFSRDGNQFRGRAANLQGIEATASNQREMLGQIVAQFKSAVSQCLAEGGSPEWIDPPMEKREEETKLFLPIHL